MLEGVPLAQRTALAQSGSVHHFRAGAFVFIAGDQADAVCCLVEGRVQIESPREDGRTMLRAVLGPGQLFGELGVLADIPRTSSALALDDCAVWTVPAREVMGFLRQGPAPAQAHPGAGAVPAVRGQAAAQDPAYP